MSLTTCILSEEFEILCGDLGIDHPSVLSQQALTYCAKHGKRDLVFEVSPGDMLIPGGVIPSLLVKRYGKKPRIGNVSTAIVLMDKQMLEAADEMLSRLPEIKRRPYRNWSVIGLNGNARQDLKDLSSVPELLVSTPQRLIDHIRRDNIKISTASRLTVLRPCGGTDEELLSFDHDVLFIHSKLSPATAVHLFTASPYELGEFQELVRRPKVVFRREWHATGRIITAYCADPLSPELLRDVIYSRGTAHAAVLCEDQLQKRALEAVLGQAALPIDGVITCFQDYHPSMAEGVKAVYFYGLSSNSLQELLHSAEGVLPDLPEIIMIHQPGQEPIITQLQETCDMKSKKAEKPTNMDIDSGKVQILLEEIKQHKHPERLAEMKRNMKKQVPFHLRSYLLAYLLGEKLSDAAPKKRRTEGGPQEDMTTIFVSIGKNRKMFPKDLIRMFKEKTNIQDSDIGTVRVLDNYSFVNVSHTIAPQVINSMDGMDVRGRTITVNFAKKKNT